MLRLLIVSKYIYDTFQVILDGNKVTRHGKNFEQIDLEWVKALFWPQIWLKHLFFPLFTHLTLNEIINTQSSEFPYRKWQSFLKLR